ncbi:hypothetical protein PR001_g3144 [Phytophthora rubi]|uniref:RxLR effector protein n=1 Tax=Phytophthora rubi TaxID=129364 RepID=A0A6A3NQ37_9STRA|nr:hypothetical protein PR002_g3192 [Phytophthora rubi]KAE9049620.1 hypothetical protein PR001_g3144 [Phytophthora rubi]
MLKLFATLVIVAITFGSTSAGDASITVKSLRVQERRLLEASASGSTASAHGGVDAGESLYEKEKCSWYDHFKFWGCCGWSCK